jgi:hypothetical protein
MGEGDGARFAARASSWLARRRSHRLSLWAVEAYAGDEHGADEQLGFVGYDGSVRPGASTTVGVLTPKRVATRAPRVTRGHAVAS